MSHTFSRRAVLAGGAAFMVSLAACGSGEDDSDSADLSGKKAGSMGQFRVGDQFKATEPLSFGMLYNNHSFYPLKNDWLFWSELTKRTNITIQPVAVPLSDYKQKRSVMIAAGDAPAIVPKTYHPDENASAASGAIIPVSDYIDLMPNFKEKLEKWKLGPEIDTLRQADGKFYLLPGLHEKPWMDYSLVMRSDILQQLNLKVPTTWDEVYSVLKAMKAAYPDVYPLSDRFNKPTAGGNLLSIVAAGFGTWGGWSYQHASWDGNAKKFFYTGASDPYKKAIQYLNRLVSEGLLDPEGFTQIDDDARRKLANGKSFVISGNAQTLVNENRPDIAKTIPTATLIKIPLPIGPSGEVNPASRLENGIVLTKKALQSKNFVAMLQFIDWLWYSDAGEHFCKWGVEGTTYVKGADGNPTLAPDVDVVGLNPKGTKHLQKDFGFYNGIFAYGGKPELVQAFFSAEERENQKIMNSRKPAPWVTPPPYPFTDEEREQTTLWESGLYDYVFQMSLKFILGQRPMSEWDAYVNELKAKNMTQYMDTVNKAYKRYQKEHG